MKITGIFAVLALLGLFVLTSAAPATADPRCPEQARVCYWKLPADVEERQKACFRDERAARGIPQGREAYLEWWYANRGTALELDYSRAFRACRHTHTQPGGMWNTATLELEGWE